MAVEFPGIRYLLAGFVRDDTITTPLRVVRLLEKLKTLFVELVFVPVVLGEELVQDTLAFGRENEVRDALDGLVAGRNKDCDARFRVTVI
ncbi:hypothetical protein [Natrinema sp. SYSU A 869]|uniref:hypothetical protein n=1 Tax=Natrinema sp. SYSU A 869 TaxID=2871694 RepID=UPI001CA40E68|nr:hypothetical protein [Natrinema sp. SYSU A 869]